MSGFSASWLDLREPADRAARDATLVKQLTAHFEARGGVAGLLDIGCGSGSTWRCLAPHLPPQAHWTLLDHDAALLAEAERRIGKAPTFRKQDLADVEALPLDGVDIVTASALFDLCSQAFCERLLRRLAANRCGLYAALTYDGRIDWSRPHPRDAQAVADFNRHQTGDKGFGPALGPRAAEVLAQLAQENGFAVQVAASPWRMGPEEAALQQAFIEGFRRPLLEIGTLADDEIEQWLAFRQAQIALPGSLCVVGHADLLAVPA